ncbi:MAG TPA: hypothetical protein VGF59_35980 [Bryobacteraceae bacterium]
MFLITGKRLLLVTLLAACNHAAAKDLKEFLSPRFAYSVRYPGEWHLSGPSDPFQITNYAASESPRAVVIPDDGAIIRIGVPAELRPLPRNPTTLDEWVSFGTAHFNVTRKRAMNVGVGTGKIAVIEATIVDDLDAPRYQETLDWFFQKDGGFFMASLMYWRGNPAAPKLREVLTQVVSSLRVLHR